MPALPSSRTEWWIAGALAAALVGGAVWYLLRPTAEQRLAGELRALAREISEGGHVQALEWMSPEFRSRLRSLGFEDPRHFLLAARQFDQQQRATYAFESFISFTPEDFAEAAFTRRTPAGRDAQSFAVPLVWRDGRWWVTDSFRTEGVEWERIPGF